MAIDFPSSGLVVGQIFVAPNGVSYQWDGTLWKAVSMTGGNAPGDFYAYTGNAGSSASPITILFNSVLSGNQGGWYNASNGRYTPPAGRYKLSTQMWGYSSAGSVLIQMYVRKNGTSITASAPGMTTAGANYWGGVTYDCIFDANGTDWFDVQMSTSVALSGSLAMFGAFAVPDGKPAAGFVGVPWRQLGRVIPTAGQATVDFQNVPSDINDLRLSFDVTPTTNAAHLLLQFYDNSNVLDVTTGHYAFVNTVAGHQQNNTNPSALGSAGALMAYS